MAVTSTFRKNALERLVQDAKRLRLYTSDSSPGEGGDGFVEVPEGNGYSTGGYELASDGSDWDLSEVSGVWRATLVSDHYWTASGGAIENIAGMYITDDAGSVLAWWGRSEPVTLQQEDTLRVSGVFVYSDSC